MATTKNIQSVERAFSILEFFQKANYAEHSLKELTEALELNKSTTFGLVNTLANLGYLQQNPENQKYSLGLRVLNFSNAVRAQNLIIRAVHPYLEQINRKYGETVHCAVPQNTSVIYVDKVEAVSSIYISTQIGTQNALHCTGVGKCVLAYLPPYEQERVLSSPMQAMTANTITTPQQLRECIQQVRKNGYATDNEEISVGLSCVAVPVFSAAETVSCAISVSGMTARIQAACEKGLVAELKQAARAISRDTFGYSPV